MLYIDHHIGDFDLAAALSEISAQRREQALRFRHELGQRQCVLAYLLLKRGLRAEYGLTDNPLFDYGEHGKPTIVGRPDICFNLSHCRRAVACVLADHPVGVDVESLGRYRPALARHTMNERELEQIELAERPDVAFTRLWTMKEARLKLTGEGIGSGMRDVLDDSTGYRFTTTVNLEHQYVCTVCE